MLTRKILRWLGIVMCGGYGGLWVVSIFAHFVRRPGEWSGLGLFLLAYMLSFGAILLAAAWFLLRRRYESLCTLVAVVASLAVFSMLLALPEWIGFYDWAFEWVRKPGFWLVGLPLSLVFILLPFYALGWTFRHVERFLLNGSKN